MHFVAQEVPYYVRDEKQNLENKRETGRLPKFAARYPEENIGDEESNDAPLDREHDRVHELAFHVRIVQAILARER